MLIHSVLKAMSYSRREADDDQMITDRNPGQGTIKSPGEGTIKLASNPSVVLGA